MDSDNLITSLSREYCRLAKAQGLITQFSLKEIEGIEIQITGEQQTETMPAMDSIIFLRGMIAGAKAASAISS